MNSRNLACGSAVLALIEAEPRVSVADRGAEWLPVGNSVRLSEEDSGNYDVVHGRGAVAPTRNRKASDAMGNRGRNASLLSRTVRFGGVLGEVVASAGRGAVHAGR